MRKIQQFALIGGLVWGGLGANVEAIATTFSQNTTFKDSNILYLSNHFEFLNLENTLVQQPSVSQLSDVQPTDWAFQALQSLQERYGAITGYPDGMFRGNQALTRYEFAAGLNAVLERISQDNLWERVTQEDLQMIERLIRDYQDVLVELRSQLQNLENRTTELEANVFSTTTLLQGQVIFAPTGGTKNATLVAYGYLDLMTYFTPNSLLLTELEFGNNGADSVSVVHEEELNFLGSNGELADGGGLDYISTESTFNISRFYYSFQPFEQLTLTVGAKMAPSDFIDQNRFANDSARDFNSGFFVNNPLIVQNQIELYPGAGVGFNWQLGTSQVQVNGVYIATDANEGKSGFFGDRNQASIELEYTPFEDLTVRLQYTYARINDVKIHAFGLNTDWLLNQTLGIFSRLGFGDYQGFNSVLEQRLDLNPITWSIGIVLQNLFLPQSLAGIAIGQPFVESGLGDGTQTNIEGFYQVNLNDNLSITPALILVNHANNNERNGLVWQGVMRVVFSF